MIGERKRNETYEGRRGCGLNTRVVRVDKDNPDKTVLQEVGEVIKKGGLAPLSVHKLHSSLYLIRITIKYCSPSFSAWAMPIRR